MKYLKYLLIVLLIFPSFLNVFALDLTAANPPNFTFGNNAESTQNITAVTTYDDGYEAHSTVTITSSTSQAGASVCFDTPYVLVQNHLYNFVIVVSAEYQGTAYSISIPSYNNYTFLRAGYYVADAMTRRGATDIKYFNATPYDDGSQLQKYVLFYLFSVNGQYNSVCLPLATTTQTSAYWGFYGYSYEDNGFVDQLTSQQIQSIISSTESSITTSINYTNNLINNTTTAIINGQEQINDTITDSNLDNENDSLIDDFLDSLDEGDYGFQDIITAPLDLFLATTNTCVPVNMNIIGANTTLPCGTDIFWNKTEIAPLTVFWNIMFGGAAIYFNALMLFNTVKNATDPLADSVATIRAPKIKPSKKRGVK